MISGSFAGDERFDYIREQCKLSPKMEKRRIQELRKLGEELMTGKTAETKLPPSSRKPETDEPSTSNLERETSNARKRHMSVKAAYARAAFLDLDAEARAEFQKWVAGMPVA